MNPQTSADALNQLNAFRQNRKSATDIYNTAEKQTGVSGSRARVMGLRGAIANTENLLRNVDPSVTGRTQGSLVSEAQRQKIVANESAPIAERFRTESGALEGETANLNELAQRAMQQAQLGIGEQQTQEQSLQSLYNTLFAKEKEAEDKRRWEEQQRQFWADFEERKRQADMQASALRAQTAATSEAIRKALAGGDSLSYGSGGGASEYSKVSKDDVINYNKYAESQKPEVFSGKNINNAVKGGYFNDPISKYGPMALIGKGWLW